MALYIREVVVAERAVVVLQRVGGGVPPERTPQDQEEALVLWISYVTQALQERIHQQVQSQVSFITLAVGISHILLF